MRNVVFSILICVGWQLNSNAQLDALEIFPHAILPVYDWNEHYRPNIGIQANYYYDDSPSHSLYGGVGFHHLNLRGSESGYLPLYAIQTYYGGALKFQLIDDVFALALGGEIGSQFNLYINPQFFNFETTLGLSPYFGVHWRPNGSWATLKFNFKYNVYFSLSDQFYWDGISSGIHQWWSPGLALMVYI